QRDDADWRGLAESADHQPELFAAPDHAEQRFGAAGIDAHRFEPPAKDEADSVEQYVCLVNDRAGGVVSDLRVPHHVLQCLIGYALKVLMPLQKGVAFLTKGGAFRFHAGWGPKTPPGGGRLRPR